jgi:hypothetical protein
MTAAQKFSASTSSVALWLNQNPIIARVAMVAIPLAIALVAAAFGHQTVFACPPIPSGSSGCGG